MTILGPDNKPLAPLGTVRIRGVHITETFSAVTIVCDESADLDRWLWSTDTIHSGRALGTKFLLTIDGVKIRGRRVFASYLHSEPGHVLTVTTESADTRIAAIGRRVGQVAHEASLVRLAENERQRKLPGVEPAESKRVTVEVPA